MKQFIWMLCGIFLSGLLLGTLSACGAHQYSMTGMTAIWTSPPSGASADSETAPAPAEETDAVPAEESGPESPPDSASKDGEAVPDEDTARRLAYAKALEDALFNGVLPDGTELDYLDAETAANNDFAICDVDGDGEEELVLLWVDAGTAGMRGIVFGYRDGALYEKLSEFPGLSFYDNGVVQADWSHNQGLGGRIWPYNLYRYNAGSGVYELIGAVDAWDIGVRDTDYEGNPFPHDLDADGDGLVYYLLPADWEGQYSAAVMVDGADHESWRNAYLDGAKEMELQRQKLTQENLADLGYWSIPGPTQESVS